MKYRKLNAELREKDKELVNELTPHTANKMPDEPFISFHIWFFYFNPSHLKTARQNEKDRSLGTAFSSLPQNSEMTRATWGRMKEWAKEYRWMERSMVYDWLTLNSVKEI